MPVFETIGSVIDKILKGLASILMIILAGLALILTVFFIGVSFMTHMHDSSFLGPDIPQEGQITDIQEIYDENESYFQEDVLVRGFVKEDIVKAVNDSTGRELRVGPQCTGKIVPVESNEYVFNGTIEESITDTGPPLSINCNQRAIYTGVTEPNATSLRYLSVP